MLDPPHNTFMGTVLLKSDNIVNSPAVQWLGLPLQGAWVQSMVCELRSSSLRAQHPHTHTKKSDNIYEKAFPKYSLILRVLVIYFLKNCAKQATPYFEDWKTKNLMC